MYQYFMLEKSNYKRSCVYDWKNCHERQIKKKMMIMMTLQNMFLGANGEHMNLCINRFLKKIIALSVISFLAVNVFAQNEELNVHFSKAQDYEAQKKWIYALGEYYEAMTENLAESYFNKPHFFDAYNRWAAIADSINSGNPGLGEFDAFEFADNWVSLLKEYEKYWTENCPYIFYVKKPARQKLNLETKTANYTIGTYLEKCKKFNEIDKIIQTGFKKAYKNEWNLDYLKDWPEVSVYSDKKYDEQYLVDGVALSSEKVVMKKYYLYGGVDYKQVDCFLSENLNKGKFDLFTPYFYTKYLPKKTASLATIKEYEYYPNKTWVDDFVNNKYLADYCSTNESRYKVSLYDIKFVITDKSGNKFFESPRCNTNYVCEWNDVPQDVMKLIESDEIDSSVTEVYLEYGKIEDFSVKGNRSYLKNLPELKIENFSYNKENEDIFEKIHEIEKEIERQKQELQEEIATFKVFDYTVAEYANREVDNRNLYENAVKRIKKSGKNHAYSVSNCGSVSRFDYYDSNDSLWFNQRSYYLSDFFEKYGKEAVCSVWKYLLCNAISEADGLQPYYICSAENTYDTKVEWFLDNFDKISENSKSAGWHIPSVSEIEYVKRKRYEQSVGFWRISDGRDEYYLGFIGDRGRDFIIRAEK